MNWLNKLNPNFALLPPKGKAGLAILAGLAATWFAAQWWFGVHMLGWQWATGCLAVSLLIAGVVTKAIEWVIRG